MDVTLHRIEERTPGVYGVLLAPCSCRVLAHLLVPDPRSVVWLIAFHPHHVMEWVELPLPVAVDQPAERVMARLPRYDLQFPLADFLARLPRLRAPAGMLAVQLAHPVPATLSFDDLAGNPQRHQVLREHGWRLTFDLPRDGEPAWLECPERAHLERVLANPVIASRELP